MSRRVRPVALLGCLLLAPGRAWAQGAMLHGIGPVNSAMGGAGAGLPIESLGALTYNPALIAAAEGNPETRLTLAEQKVSVPQPERSGKKGPRYTPVSRRQDRPNAILWLVRNHPELKDSAIMRLVGTTKSTISAIRDRTHWNAAALTPMDPVTLGLCSQIDLDFEVNRRAHVEIQGLAHRINLLHDKIDDVDELIRKPKRL